MCAHLSRGEGGGGWGGGGGPCHTQTHRSYRSDRSVWLVADKKYCRKLALSASYLGAGMEIDVLVSVHSLPVACT